MNKFRSRVLLVFLLALPFAILLRIWFQGQGLARSALVRVAMGTSIVQQVQPVTHDKAVALWQALPYTPLSESRSFRRKWSRLRVTFRTPITPEQHRQLLEDARLLLLMNGSDRTADMYRDYIAARHATCIVSVSELRQWAKELGMDAESKPLDIMAAVIRRLVKEPQLKAVCIPASAVTYRAFSKLKAPYTPILDAAVFGNAIRIGTEHRTWRLADDFSDHYDRGEPVKVAEVMLYLKAHDGAAGPSIVRLWWSARAAEWRPLEMACGSDSGKVVCFLPS